MKLQHRVVFRYIFSLSMKEPIILVISVISDYQATDNGYLKKNIQSKHEGVKYPCDLCD